MFNLINRYFINFFVWWYLVESKIFFAKLAGFWLMVMSILNVVPMLQNLFRPLYQDYTWMGRLIAFPIRAMWVFMGAFALLLLLIPLVFLGVAYLLLPIMPVLGVLGFIANNLVTSLSLFENISI